MTATPLILKVGLQVFDELLAEFGGNTITEVLVIFHNLSEYRNIRLSIQRRWQCRDGFHFNRGLVLIGQGSGCA
jgi:hypothetical protein